MTDTTNSAKNTEYVIVKYKQEAQLSQIDRATLRVIEYFDKSLKVIRNDILEKHISPY